MKATKETPMRRYTLPILALAYAGWLAWAGWQVTRAAEAYQPEACFEACDEGLDSLQIEAKYFTK